MKDFKEKSLIEKFLSEYPILDSLDSFEITTNLNSSSFNFTTQGKLKTTLPEKYIINDKVTILFWKNGEKTIVRRCKDDEFNPRLAFLTAFFQYYCGMSKNKANKYLANLEIEKPKLKKVRGETKKFICKEEKQCQKQQ